MEKISWNDPARDELLGRVKKRNIPRAITRR
jgi:hypothetical protein